MPQTTAAPQKTDNGLNMSFSPVQHAKSGFEECRRQVESGLLFLSVTYAAMLSLDLPVSPASEFCPEGEDSCRRPDLLAYKFTSAIAMMYYSTKINFGGLRVDVALADVFSFVTRFGAFAPC